jgi:hypothetical protein
MPWSRRAAAAVFFLAAGMSQWARQAAALARLGTVVSLERPVALVPKPAETRADGKPHGITFYEIRFRTFPKGDPRGNDDFSSDVQEFHVHGGMTHLDALCHYSDGRGRLYNGYPLAETVTEAAGCTKLGLDLSIVPWLKARDVAVTSGVRAIPDDRHADHRLTLVALGVFLLDGVDLTRLAETSAALNRWEFMLVVAPPQVPGRTGAIVNPLAIF